MLSRLSTKLWIVLFGFVFAACLMWLGASSARAQDAPSLQVTPAIIDSGAFPGDSAQATVQLSNLSDEPLAVQADARVFSPQDEVIDESNSERYDASRWITLETRDYLIAPRGQATASITIAVPVDAVPGGHYALVVFRILDGGISSFQSGVNVTPEVGVVTLINVPGDSIEQVEIKAVQTSGLTFGGNATVTQDILNTGNTHVAPIIETDIIDSSGTVVETITQPVQLLLPNTKRQLDLSWQSGGRIGKYRARTSVLYGTPSQSQELMSETFYVLPGFWTFVFWGGGVVILVRYGFLYLKRQATKPESKKDGVKKTRKSSKKSRKVVEN